MSSDNGLSHVRRHVIIWTSVGLLSIGTKPLGMSVGEVLVKTWNFSFKNMHMKKSAKLRTFSLSLSVLTPWERMMQICGSKLVIIGCRQWLVAWPVPSHYRNQCWNIANWTLMTKLQWNLNRNWYIFIHKNATENLVCKLVSASVC